MKVRRLRFLHDRRGATTVEYGITLALIALSAAGAISTLGGQIRNTMSTAGTKLPG